MSLNGRCCSKFMDEVLFFEFPGVITSMVEYQTTDRHVMNSLPCLVEVLRNRFTNIIIVGSDIAEVFSKAVSKILSSFTDVEFIAK